MKNININLETKTTTVSDATSEDIAEANRLKNQNEQKKQTAANEKAAKKTAQASGNTKLLGLGLSQEQVTALTGYTPE